MDLLNAASIYLVLYERQVADRNAAPVRSRFEYQKWIAQDLSLVGVVERQTRSRQPLASCCAVPIVDRRQA